MKIDLLIPSRGRPDDAAEAALSALDNREWKATRILVVIDDDDPRLTDYETNSNHGGYGTLVVPKPSRRGIVDPLNTAANLLASKGSEYIGFMGDDHRVRTLGWDDIVRNHHPAAVVYGNDLFQGSNLPTAVFMRAEVIRRLGFMAPPALQHLYVDNYWKALGEKLNSIVYDPSLVIEHLHPDIIDGTGNPKGEWDDLKLMLNSQETYTRDRVAFMQYEAGGGIDKDARRVLGEGD